MKKLILIALVTIVFVNVVSAKTIYVKHDATGAYTGTSWEDARIYLHVALEKAVKGDQIWVAAGTYKPSAKVGGTGNRHKTFQMKNDVGIYGGFNGTETALGQREVQKNETILSGDIGTIGDNTDNCYHVFYHTEELALGDTAILDGVTITAGNTDRRGGGMFNQQYSSPTVNNCTFSDNLAREGGGMYNEDFSSPTVTNCTFTSNSADFGGGMNNAVFCNPTVKNCTFIGNSASEYGGGMHNSANDSIVTDCDFSGNSAGEGGGGMYNDMSNPKVISCVFGGNSAFYGGGIYNNFNSNSIVTNCEFSSNSAVSEGGGMYNYFESSPTVNNCIFNSNSADTGGGIYNERSSNPRLIGCTITGNSANRGGGMYSDDSNPKVSNSILWGNAAHHGDNEIYGLATVSYSCVQGGDTGIGNIDTNPLFVDIDGADGIIGTKDDNLRLQAVSPCIDIGNSHAVTSPTDFDGQPRIMDGDANGTAMVDMGVYEHYGNAYEPKVIYVDADATSGNNNGASWGNAFTSLQNALEAAIIGDQIWVAAGTYYPSVKVGGTNNRCKTFQLKNHVEIHGGFNGTEIALDKRDVQNNETILSGDLLGNDNPNTPVEEMLTDPSRNDNCYHIFFHPERTNLDATAILDGFVITGSNANGSWPHYSGGGMFNISSSPTVINCTFSGNSAERGGGGMYNDKSNPTVISCTFSGNSTHYWGGGMSNWHNSPTVTGCTFIDNLAKREGGGMSNWQDCSPTVTNCTFSGNLAFRGGGMSNYDRSNSKVTNCEFIGNHAEWVGGGMCNSSGSLTVTNCIFSGNSAERGGGGMHNDKSNLNIISCTFSGNSTDYEGGGMSNWISSPNVSSSILCGNTAANGSEIYNYEYMDRPSIPVISYCDIAGSLSGGSWDASLGINGGGNIDADPRFVDADGADDTLGTEDDDLRLQEGSRCIDAGDPDYVPVPGAIDLDGNPRVMGTAVDIGAYEFLTPIEVRAYVFPRVLNTTSRGRYVIARMQLPDGVSKDDVADDSLVLIIGDVTIESVRQRGISSRGQDYVFGFFDRGRVIAQAEGKDKLDIVIAGELTTGQCIYGEDSIRIVKPRKWKWKTSRRRPVRNSRGR